MIDLESVQSHLPTFRPGTVWLVGAGPGDPALLTLAALHALQNADVVVYDALVSEGVLALVPGRTSREYVGKRGGKPSARQSDITARLMELARSGLRVVRLKGGDPFVFGRGAEEAADLARAGMPFHVVSGITAGIGGLAAAGIPLTSRLTNHGVIFLTGHVTTRDAAPVDWRRLAGTGLPLVIYMALGALRDIVAQFLAAGMAPETPAAAISNATLPDQRVLLSRLERLLPDVEAAHLAPPVIIALGANVALRAALGAGDDPGFRQVRCGPTGLVPAGTDADGAARHGHGFNIPILRDAELP
ncbi:uroporphyrinogen-III C-methyltransferase [Ancylobacter dichloromethanicus]|uniref:uroporphyrinogen-III C-methyltransferase n=1 Tax=Ancylobacter dichloromethanicus TaxID=518825 RepID=A0A9W6N1P6_9HYPH|nr:uroporphyrinogen-III C-methyltransferase [Ancylobacter dichloromethanicus]MBS7553361.1 uroporphyrinogen-III C-methyltransferase [Ancylobacter dichloromethanicus]GLK74413.1 uroporphyrin-III C-methyltransferase [Ancylobacter dichloromethanicus]